MKADSDGDEDEATFDWQSVVVPASNNRVKHLKLALADIRAGLAASLLVVFFNFLP